MTQLTQNKNGVMSLPIPVNIAMSKNAPSKVFTPSARNTTKAPTGSAT
ncbi:MAG: hypothetical protein KatS3mg027_2735 [Bacteroidia bacterium]|nr:MAG: hypothetical protein KatS3mg027_2735 [Bacteroidia bacterium]